MTYQDALGLRPGCVVHCLDGQVGKVATIHPRQQTVGIEVPGRWMLRHVPWARLERADDGSFIERPVHAAAGRVTNVEPG